MNLNMDLNNIDLNQKFIIFMSIKGFSKRTLPQKKFIQTLKLRKNKIRIMELNPVNLGLLSSNTLCTWTIMEFKKIKQLFNSDIQKLFEGFGLNNPKKGHICKIKYGYKEVELFKKEFIDRMYLRL